MALFAQAVIQPFASRGGRRFNKCHYYTRPTPPGMLETLDNERVGLKLTLSYFIEPNPGLSASVDPQRCQSHGLRFDHQRRRETVTRFEQRVNPAERDGRRPAGEGADPNCMLGEDSISAGSLHCDVWTGPAIDLLDRDTLCVKPVNGWWRHRASLDICNRKSRYALIVTLRAPNPDVEILRPSVRVSACQRRCRLRSRSNAQIPQSGGGGEGLSVLCRRRRAHAQDFNILILLLQPVAVARKQQAKSWELRAAMSMARLWRSQGKVQQGRELLAPIYGWFTEGFGGVRPQPR